MKLKVKKLNPKANIPTRAHHDDAGLDIYCCENMIIPPHTTVKVPTGIAAHEQNKGAPPPTPQLPIAAQGP
jgi:dUTPase